MGYIWTKEWFKPKFRPEEPFYDYPAVRTYDNLLCRMVTIVPIANYADVVLVWIVEQKKFKVLTKVEI